MLVFLSLVGLGLVCVEAFYLRNALHIFQLEGYKRQRFLSWWAANRRRGLAPRRGESKKPLVMTGRASRIFAVAAAVAVGATAVVPAIIWWAGTPLGSLAAMLLSGALVILLAPRVIVAADALLAPVQRAINSRYLEAARSKLSDVAPTVIGVTGSFGKTSTKFAIERLIAPAGQVLATPGSFNTPLGVCRTINERLAPQHRYFVVEMGAYGEGEIAELSDFVQPVIGVLTAIGPAHLERFGSMEAIQRAKYELVRALPSDGVAVLNVDDPAVRALAAATRHVPIVRYGLDAAGDPDVSARNVTITQSGTALAIIGSHGEVLEVTTRLLGRHSVGHILAGVAVAEALGRPLAELRTSIEGLQPVEHRLQLIEGAGGVTVIDDAYNSNPEGADAALEVLAAMPAERRVVVTPGMVELGDLQVEANRRLGARAAEVADALVVVARINREAIVEGAGQGGGAQVIVVDTLAEATKRLPALLRAGDAVLFENDLPDHYEA
jgi:UDP-N-acetylmuramoyl-tripeptide--D-alanyl-D-alanine ligase